MIRREQADEARALLAGGMSQREVAEQVGISRGTVGNIAAGKWRPRRPLPPKSAESPQTSGWCETCKHKVPLPCLVCYLRSRPLSLTDDDETLTLDLELDSEYERRYLEVAREGEEEEEEEPYQVPVHSDDINTGPRHHGYRPHRD